MSYVGQTAWIKSAPGVRGEVLSDPDHHGNMAAIVSDPLNEQSGEDNLPFVALINIEQISWVETVPVPAGVPEHVYVAIYGPDPAMWKGEVLGSEREATQFLEGRSDGFGYVPANILRGGMIPVSSESAQQTDDSE